jgi:hypothetical protein
MGRRSGTGERLRCRVLPGHPAQQRTLDARRVLRHPGEGDCVAEDVLVGLELSLGCHQLSEDLGGLHRVANSPPDHQLGQNRFRRLADRTAFRVVRDVLDTVAGEPDAHRHLVAADGVDMPDLDVKGLPQPLVLGVAVVIQDDLLVKRGEINHQSLILTIGNRR